MPVFNAEHYLQDCINSICNQTFKAWELLAVDDFSTDHSYEILQKAAQTDGRIRVFKNQEKGIIPALQMAFSKAKGKFITRMDADDLMPITKLTLFYNAIKNTDKIVVTGKVRYFSDQPITEGYLRYEKWLNKRVATNDFDEQLYRECVIASPNWLVNRSFFEQIGGFKQINYPEDYDLVFRWHKYNYRFVGIDQVTHLWREHSNRTSRNSAIYQQYSFFTLKTNWFIQLVVKNNTSVQLIGAGKKGKIVAAILTEKNIAFEWCDRRAERYNQLVLGKEIKSVNQLQSTKPTILTNWPLDEKQQLKISSFLQSKGIKIGENCYLF